MFNYADENYISVNHKELKLVRDALEEESKIMVEWFNSKLSAGKSMYISGHSF